jgi:ADP-ribosylglycohydrolase
LEVPSEEIDVTLNTRYENYPKPRPLAMTTTARQLLLPSLCADALALGTHWIYNPAEIARLHPGGVRNYDDPRTDYHPAKSAGDFTHYGDQTLALLRSVVLRQGFSADGWREDWHQFWINNPPAYRDGATKDTLGFLERGVDAASESNDLAGAARIAPILALLADRPLAERIDAARAQTALTHGDRTTIDAAEFFTRATDALLGGAEISAALETAASAPYPALHARDFLDQAKIAADLDPTAAGEKFGLTCHTPEAFPLTLWLLLHHSGEPLEALVANTTAGGDNAARGLIIGLLMGAAHGLGWLPSEWLDGLNPRDEIDALIATWDRRCATDSCEEPH